jgi:hypothetical protein
MLLLKPDVSPGMMQLSIEVKRIPPLQLVLGCYLHSTPLQLVLRVLQSSTIIGIRTCLLCVSCGEPLYPENTQPLKQSRSQVMACDTAVPEQSNLYLSTNGPTAATIGVAAISIVGLASTTRIAGFE